MNYLLQDDNICFQFRKCTRMINFSRLVELKHLSYQDHQRSNQFQLRIYQQHVLQGITPAQELQSPKRVEDTCEPLFRAM